MRPSLTSVLPRLTFLTAYSTPELVQANLNVNLYGVMNLVTSSLPLLRKGQAKQIFAVSSTVGSLGGLFSENSLYTAVSLARVRRPQSAQTLTSRRLPPFSRPVASIA